MLKYFQFSSYFKLKTYYLNVKPNMYRKCSNQMNYSVILYICIWICTFLCVSAGAFSRPNLVAESTKFTTSAAYECHGLLTVCPRRPRSTAVSRCFSVSATCGILVSSTPGPQLPLAAPSNCQAVLSALKMANRKWGRINCLSTYIHGFLINTRN